MTAIFFRPVMDLGQVYNFFFNKTFFLKGDCLQFSLNLVISLKPKKYHVETAYLATLVNIQKL